jgi:hypothetical protein
MKEMDLSTTAILECPAAPNSGEGTEEARIISILMWVLFQRN